MTGSWQGKLRRLLAGGRGVRMGEAAVVSRKLHLTEIERPEAVIILIDRDFGETAYGRTRQGEVVHIDVFHAVAEVDHRQVAAAVRGALQDAPDLMDYFDVGTATGAGRITSAMDRARRLAPRMAHRNHVHLAGLLPEAQWPLLWRIVDAVEQAILNQGVELRRIERLIHRRGGAGSSVDADIARYYADDLDSYIKEESSRPGAGQSLRGGARGSVAGERPDPAADGGIPRDEAADEELLQRALALSKQMGSPEELCRLLEDLAREQGWSAFYQRSGNQAPFLLRMLEEAGLIRKEVRGLRLSQEGRALLNYLRRHMRDVKLRFRKLVRRIPGGPQRPAGSNRRAGRGAGSSEVCYGPIRGTAPAQAGAWLNDLAVPETVGAAIRRTYLERLGHQPEQSQSGPSQSGPSQSGPSQSGPSQSGRSVATMPLGLRLQRSDVHLHLRAAEQRLHICLLIDASASMAGRRILAAKHLARHLLLSTRDRVAVIAFQEREVKVYVPFTRDWGLLEAGLTRIQPMGLTPLAHGLTQSMELIRTARVRHPLLLLISDGIPTVPKWTIDPLADALEAARQVRAARVPFSCIGLQPSRRYLEQLSREAGGTLYVVDELSEESLIRIAHTERYKLAPKK